MRTLFMSTGSDPLAHIRRHALAVPAPEFEGVWATIELQPDAFAPQRYTVGVIVGTRGGPFSFRLLDDLSKFECIYGRDDLGQIRELMEAAEQGMLRAQKNGAGLEAVPFETDAISIGSQWATSGVSVDAVLSRLYYDVVPLVPREERKTREFITLDNAAVRRLVDDELKKIAGLSFERISTEPQRALLDESTGQSHWLEFNLAPPGKAGSVISAVYKTPTSVELNFLRASRDLTTYARVNRFQDRGLGLFVMTPATDSMPALDRERIENILGEQSWSLEQQGFVVSAHDDPGPLARDVYEWASVD
ncbi:hypothetical protein QF001_005391 [Paraburkholderia youngii]|uniref:hypothetical protein n=1 Tax=Paraburkholderia youngii TaxID=2782701 RepID=UPI003D24C37F